MTRRWREGRKEREPSVVSVSGGKRWDSRCFVTARINPASRALILPFLQLLERTTFPCTHADSPLARRYAHAFVPMTSLKYGWLFHPGQQLWGREGGSGLSRTRSERARARGPKKEQDEDGEEEPAERGQPEGGTVARTGTESQRQEERFCFLVTFIWPRERGFALHKSGGTGVCASWKRGIVI